MASQGVSLGINQLDITSNVGQDDNGQFQLQFNSSNEGSMCWKNKTKIVVLAMLAFTIFLVNATPYLKKKQTTLLMLGISNHDQNLQSTKSVEKLSKRLSLPCIIVLKTNEMSILSHKKSQCQTIFISSSSQYDLTLLDKISRTVETEYLFILTSDWPTLDDRLITESEEKMKKSDLISSVIVGPNKDNNTKKFSFAFSPALHRLADLQIMLNSTAVTKTDSIFEQETQKKVKEYYHQNGLLIYTISSASDFLSVSNQSTQNKIDQTFQTIQNTYQQKVEQNKKIVTETPHTENPFKNQVFLYESKEHQKLKKAPSLQQKTVEAVKPPTKTENYYYFKEQQNKNASPPQTQKVQPKIQQNKEKKPAIENSSKQLQDKGILAYGQFDPISRIQKYLTEAPTVFQIDKLSSFKELPFCLILVESDGSRDQILISIYDTGYSNINIVIPQLAYDYFTLKSQLKQECPHNSYLLFVNAPLSKKSLQHLNQAHQKYTAWITYTKTKDRFQIFSVLFRVFDLLEKNDFAKNKRLYFLKNDITAQTLGLLELCLESNKLINKQMIMSEKNKAYLFMDTQEYNDRNWTSYTKILRLNQDIVVPIDVLDKLKKNVRNFKPNKSLEVSVDNMLRAIDRQEERYLPENHSIYDLEFQDYNRKFNISQYSLIEKQIPFCVTILSHNNVENDRYKKVIDSILHQSYSNYHIVFIDDVSTDQNMNSTIRYLKEKKFPKERVKFVQNKQRNYATYNIVNVAFNFCNQNDIQMLIDGDDEFIGKYAFQAMNSAYQQDPELWVVYSSYKSTYYEYGRSAKLTSDSQFKFPNNRRRYISNIGVIRTWRVKLIHQIPPYHHKMRNGKWLDTVYDDAIQHPLFELSTVRRVRYVNEILYDYTVNYGGNDNSTPQKHRYRVSVYDYIARIQALSPLPSLQGRLPNNEITQQLKKDKNVRYQLLQSVY